MLRCYGRTGLQARIREHVRLARAVRGAGCAAEPGWEVVAPRHFSLVCFRLDAPDEDERAAAGAGQRVRARCSSRTRGSATATCCGSRSAASARPRTTCASRGTCSAARRPRCELERLTGTYLLGDGAVARRSSDEGRPRARARRRPARARRAAPYPTASASGSKAASSRAPPLVFFDGDPCPGGVLGGVLHVRACARRRRCSPAAAASSCRRSSFRARRARRLRAAAPRELARSRDGDWLELGGEFPRWRFVEWLTRQDAVIFHGSPKDDIDVFRPFAPRSSSWTTAARGTSRRSTGRRSGSGRCGSRSSTARSSGARSGTASCAGPIATGRSLDLYHFSVDHSHVGGDIWRSGTLYLLPREPFRPSPFFPGGPDSSEWASPRGGAAAEAPRRRSRGLPVPRAGGRPRRLRADPDRGGRGGRPRPRARTPPAWRTGSSSSWSGTTTSPASSTSTSRSTRKYTPDVERRLVARWQSTATLEIRGSAGFLQSFEGSLARRGIAVSD